MPLSSVLWYVSAGGLTVLPIISYSARRKLRGPDGDHPMFPLWLAATLSMLGVLMFFYKIFGVQVTANP